MLALGEYLSHLGSTLGFGVLELHLTDNYIQIGGLRELLCGIVDSPAYPIIDRKGDTDYITPVWVRVQVGVLATIAQLFILSLSFLADDHVLLRTNAPARLCMLFVKKFYIPAE